MKCELEKGCALTQSNLAQQEDRGGTGEKYFDPRELVFFWCYYGP